MYKLHWFQAALCSLGVLIGPFIMEAKGAGHGGGGHGGGHGGSHGGSVHVAHTRGVHVNGIHAGGAQFVHSGSAHFVNGARGFDPRGANFNRAGRDFDRFGRFGRDFDRRDFDRFGRDFNRRGFFWGGGYFGYPFGWYGYGYGGYPYYDGYYNSYYNAPAYSAPLLDYDLGYSAYTSPAYDYGPAGSASYAAPAYGYAKSAPALSAPARVNNTAEVTVFLPQPDAQIWVNDKSMPSNSTTRRSFVSPSLKTGRPYTYRISAGWMENGRQVRVDKTVSLTAGRPATVDFTSASRPMPVADE